MLQEERERETRLRRCEEVLEVVREPDATTEQRLHALEATVAQLLAERLVDELEQPR